MHTAYLGLGSNLGDRKVNLRRALKLLGSKVKVEARSPVYETDPMYIADQPKFYNMVVRASTKLSPHELLSGVKKVEATMGRASATHNLPRIIDVDILLYGDEVVETDELEIPHPRLAERAFVLAPLRDLAPELVPPRRKRTVAELLARIEDWRTHVRKTNVRV